MTSPQSTEKFDRLKAILRTMFQLDRGDLDFGLYRIMNLKVKEITGFLDNDLLPQVRTALAGERLQQAGGIGKGTPNSDDASAGFGDR